ncbi:MAG: tetraacyldisaccharide 4'-kinase [Chthonomonadales bacterium]|nr:tetraacyldisaccharide 4'-kinase [Chthonomonadales bacterium]
MPPLTPERFLPIIDGTRRDPAARLTRGALAALAPAYVAGLRLYLAPYRLGIRRQARLPCSVISVGNLTTGGTGKTPMTQRIAAYLLGEGLRVCVLSRGYRGAAERGAEIVSTADRVLLGAAQAGDEAYMLARLLPGVPVMVGRDRRVTGALAAERFAPDAIVLDDGMQFYQLHRDLDVVLLDAAAPFGDGRTLPRGLLREPPSHLRRAGVVVLTGAERAGAAGLQRAREQVGRHARSASLFAADYACVSLRALDRSLEREVEWLVGRPVATLCALGNPEAFEEQARRAGGRLVHAARLPDHHAATLAELNEAIAAAQAAGAEAILVSEKDAVKLPPLNRPLPFYALIARLRLDNEAAFFARVLEAAGRPALTGAEASR